MLESFSGSYVNEDYGYFAEALNKLYIHEDIVCDGKPYSREEQAIALVENMYISDLLKPAIIWESICVLKNFKDDKIAFQLINDVLKESGAYSEQKDIKNFNAKLILKRLFQKNSIFQLQDAEDFSLYIRQTAFGRDLAQERNNLTKSAWMQDAELIDKYIKNFQTLGLLSREQPSSDTSDEIWVFGASKPVEEVRLRDLNQLIASKGFKTDVIRLLGGKRELSVGLDGKEYILELAKKLERKYDENNPFLMRGNQEYLNYLEGVERLYETDMINDLYSSIFGQAVTTKQEVIDSDKAENRNRPDTIQTINDSMTKLLNRIESGDLKNKEEITVLLVSSQPFCERQKLQTKITLDKALKEKNIKIKIKFESLGREASYELAKSRIEVLHSDGMGSLSATQYQLYTQGENRVREIDLMLYSKRAEIKNKLLIPPMPSDICSPSHECLRIEIPQNIGQDVHEISK
jgi:hypothetical protein